MKTEKNLISYTNAQLSQDIVIIQNILEKVNKSCNVITDIYSVSKLKDNILSNGINYHLPSFVINLRQCSDKNPKTKQTIKNIKLEFSMKIDTTNYKDKNITTREDEGQKLYTYFNHYEFNILVKANDKEDKNYIYALHLDMHDGSQSNVAHPEFHFQYGGRHLKDNYIDYGNILILDTPRIMHYPMDFILGLDFILSNFAPIVYQKVKEHKEYNKILKKYQDMFIVPYFKSIYKKFDNNISDNFREPHILFPQLV